jgi:HrpA-like RNA helicase
MSEPVVNVHWHARCKDCQREQGAAEATYSYTDAARRAQRERGESPSDRCPRHRLEHRRDIRSMPVPYIDVATVGTVADPLDPGGALGNLGPLPVEHERRSATVDPDAFDFGIKDQHVRDLLAALADGKRVAVVAAGTGSGKSTFLPFRLLHPPSGAALHLAAHGPIVVTEPRVFATTDVADMVSRRLGGAEVVGAGSDVGFRVRGKPAYDAGCRLVFMTDGSLINWIRDGALARLGAVVIDEAHERSRNIDLILAILRAELPRHPHLRVIIASATIDPDFFVDFFGGPSEVAVLDIDARKSFGYGEPLWPGVPFGELAPAWGDAGELAAAERAAGLRVLGGPIDRAAWRDDMPRLVAEQLARIALGTPSGDALGFLATERQIIDARDRLRGLVGDAADVYGLLRSASEEEQRAAREPRPDGAKRRLVIATNIAETSLTIDGLTYVVDSGLICQSEWDPVSGTRRLPIKPHSRQGVRQRWGRVGRNAPGLVFPLYTREQFDTELPASTPPEATRDDLEGLVLQAAAMGYADPRALSWPAAGTGGADEKARREAEVRADGFALELDRAVAALEARGALTEDGDPTATGLELLAFTGSMVEAAAIAAADQLSCPVEALTALAVLGQHPISGPRGLLRFDRGWSAPGRLAAIRRHESLRHGCQDDLDLVLRVFARWERAADRSAWARRHAVGEEVLLKAQQRRDEWLEFLSPGRAEVRQPVRPALAGRVRAAFTHALADRRHERHDGAWKPEGGDDSRTAQLEPGTIASGDRIVALRQSVDEDGKLRLGGVMVAPEWARDADDLLALALACAEHAADRAADAVLAQAVALEDAWPIGSVHRCNVARRPNGRVALESLELLRAGPEDPLVFEPPTGSAADVGGPRDLVPLSTDDAVVVDDDQEPQFTDLAAAEPEDAEASQPRMAAEARGDGPAPATARTAPAVTAEARAEGSVPATGAAEVLVLGWEGADAHRRLVVAALPDGADLTAAARGETRAFLVGERVDRRGLPFLSLRAGAWETAVTAGDLTPAFDGTLLDVVESPLTLEVAAVADGMLLVSGLGAALRDLGGAPRSARPPVNGDPLITARVTGEIDARRIEVTIDPPERRASPIPIRFRAQQHGDDGERALAVGAAADVLLRPSREKDRLGALVDPQRAIGTPPAGLAELCERVDALDLDAASTPPKLIARGPIGADVKAELLELGDAGAWAAAVEDLWQRSRRLRVVAVRRGRGPAPRATDLETLARARDDGTVLAGTVSGVEEYGVFVRLEGCVGLAHRSQIGPHGALDPREHFAEGDPVRAQVLEVAPDGSSIKLALPDADVIGEQSLQTPADVLRALPVGSRRTAVVDGIGADAVFLKVAFRLRGRLTRAQLGDDRFAALEPKQTIDVEIEGAFLDRQRGVLRLELRPAPPATDAGAAPPPAPAPPADGRDNGELVRRALRIVVRHLAPVVERRLAARLGPEWASQAAGRLQPVPPQLHTSDPQTLLALLREWWFDAGFVAAAGRDGRDLVNELSKARNDWAHFEPISDERLENTFETAAKLLRRFDIDAEEELRDALPAASADDDPAPLAAPARRPATFWIDPRVAEALAPDTLRAATLAAAVAPRADDPDALVVAIISGAADVHRDGVQDLAHALRGRLGAPLAVHVVRDRRVIRDTVTDYLRHLVPRERWELLRTTTTMVGDEELHVLVHPDLRTEIPSGDWLLALVRALGFEHATVHYGIPHRK